MSSPGTFGSIAGTYDGTQVEWKIEYFSAMLEDEVIIESPRFSLGNTVWYIRLWIKSTSDIGCMALTLSASKSHDYKFGYELGFKRNDNNVELIHAGILEERRVCTDYCYIERSKLLERKSELIPKDELTITCYLKRGEILPINTKPKTLKSLDILSENFADLFCDKKSCDVTLHVKGTDYKVHKTVLIARSSVFREMFQDDTSKTFPINNCDKETFEIFLKFLYDAKLEELSPSRALHLYKTSAEYKVQELSTYCSEYLMENLSVENIFHIVVTANSYGNTKLLLAVQKFFNKNLNKVLNTSEWKCFMQGDPHLANQLMVEMSTKIKVLD